MTSFANLLGVKPDKGGTRAENRLQFQKQWTLWRLLELHAGSDDYAVLCDCHEDVVVLNSASDPTVGMFFQIKTKTAGTWTLHELSKPPPLPKSKKGEAKATKKPLSILGKLYKHHVDFGGYAFSLAFVSNVSFKIDLEKGSSLDETVINFSDLLPSERTKLADGLKEEHPPEAIVDVGLHKFRFLVSSLSLGDQATHAKGKLLEFLSGKAEGHTADDINTLHRVLTDEVGRRTGYEGSWATLGEALKHKGVTRAAFQNLLDSVRPRQRTTELISAALARLNSEQVPWNKVNTISSLAPRYSAERFDSSNLPVQQLRSAIRTWLEKHSGDEFSSLWQMLMTLLGELKVNSASLVSTFQDGYMLAAATLEVALYGTPELQKASEKPENKSL